METNNNIGSILNNAGAVPANTSISSPYMQDQIHIREPSPYANLNMNLDVNQQSIPNLDVMNGETALRNFEELSSKGNIKEEINMNNQQTVAQQQPTGQVVYQQPVPMQMASAPQPQQDQPGIFDRVTSTISENKGAIIGAAAGAAAMYLFTNRDSNEAAESAFNEFCNMF